MVGEERIPSRTVLWCAGVAASPLGKSLGLPLDRAGRVPIQPDLTIDGHPEVFVVGDMSTLPDAKGQPLPGQAPVAIQEGRWAAANLSRAIAGEPMQAFTYVDEGSMATIGRNQAVAEFPSGLRFHGRIGWLMWLGLHLVYLIGFRNRVAVLVNWWWNYLTYDHSARTLVESPH